jgi:hypothetical protein
VTPLPLRLALASLGVLVLTSCTDAAKSSAAPPTKVCGVTMSSSAAGAVLEDVSRGDVDLPGVSVGGNIYLRVAQGCRHGAVVTWTPPDGARLVLDVKSQDGHSTAVVLKPRGSTALQVRVQQAGAVRSAHLPAPH